MNPSTPPPSRGRVVLTYGTFDLFHIGHLNLLKRLKALGDYLIVAVSTDEFNQGKGKKTIIRFEDRMEIVRSVRCVDLVIPETRWEQKIDDVREHGVAVFGMGEDWAGKFDFLRPHCEVVYLPRTSNISSTSLKHIMSSFSAEHVDRMRAALDSISGIVANLSGGSPERAPTAAASAGFAAGEMHILPRHTAGDLRQSA